MEEVINNLLDILVLKTQDKESFNQLSPEQRAIGALEFLIGTTTRSGAEVFFSEETAFLFQDAEQGLELVKATESKEIFRAIITTIKNGKKDKNKIKQLQENMVSKNFNLIYDSIRKYVQENFDHLSKDL